MTEFTNELSDSVMASPNLARVRGITDFQTRLLTTAIRAPSGDNCQPWRFHFESERLVRVSADFNRAKSFFDFEHRATALSIGAAIENMRVQAASEGFATELAYAAEGAGADYATLTFSPNEAVRISRARVAALFQRTVNRRPFLPMAIPPSLRVQLLEEPLDGVMVQMITERRDISQWADVIEIGDRIRYSHPVIHEELFSKLLVNRQMAQDVRMGLEIDRLGVGPLGGMLLRWLRPWPRVQRLSRWGLVYALARQSGLLARFTGALVLITIDRTGSQSWVRAGEQVQRLWIKAQELGLQTHPMPVALYLDQRYLREGLSGYLPAHNELLQRLRSQIESLIPTGTGAMLFRLGWGWPMRGQSVRLPMEKFLD
jgi:sulfur-carrier protein adenylyltransferase/sulfurtransferase